MRILVLNEKHGNRYFVVNDERELAAVATKIIHERFEEGWYYEPDNPTSTLDQRTLNLLEISDEDLAATPSAIRDNLEKEVHDARVRIARTQNIYLAEKAAYDNIVKVATSNNLVTTIKTLRDGTEKTDYIAINILHSRDCWEYEGFRIESPESF